MDFLSLETSISVGTFDAEEVLDELDRLLPVDTVQDRSHERRRRHREGMARLRSERRARINQLATQASALHRRLRQALAWMDTHRVRHEANDCRCLAYVELVAASEALLQEQYSLEDELHFRERYARLVMTDGQRLEDEEINTAETLLTTTPGIDGYWVRYATDEDPLFYEYETPEKCAAVIQMSVDNLATLRETLSSSSGLGESTHCLGWHVEYHHDAKIVQYRFTRRVSRVQTTLDDLDERTWRALRTPSQLTRMYGATVVARIVQNVSEDAFILLRNSPTRSDHRCIRYFSLTSRLRGEDSNSVAIVTTILSKQPRQVELEQRHGLPPAHQSTTVWLQSGVSCFEFTSINDDTIGIEFSGSIQCEDHGHARHLVTETCLSLLRWEQVVVPPRMLAS